MKARILVVSVFVFIILAGVAMAAPIDLWESFPDAQGGNHFYALALLFNNTGEGSYRRLDDLGPYSFGTLNETVMNVPFIIRGQDPWIQMYPASNGGTNGTGLGYENPIYTYKVPTAGTYNITGTYQKAGTGDTYVFVKHNTEFLWNHTFSLADANGTQASFALANVHLGVNDEVYYGVGSAASKKNIGDLTFLNGKINLVPEPISSVLFLVGAGVFGAAARRNRRFR
jgi:hypothetical protein